MRCYFNHMLWPTHSAYINPVQHQWEIWSDLVDSNIHHHHQNTKFGESHEESKPRSIKAFLTTNEDILCVPPPLPIILFLPVYKIEIKHHLLCRPSNSCYTSPWLFILMGEIIFIKSQSVGNILFRDHEIGSYTAYRGVISLQGQMPWPHVCCTFTFYPGTPIFVQRQKWKSVWERRRWHTGSTTDLINCETHMGCHAALGARRLLPSHDVNY